MKLKVLILIWKAHLKWKIILRILRKSYRKENKKSK